MGEPLGSKLVSCLLGPSVAPAPEHSTKCAHAVKHPQRRPGAVCSSGEGERWAGAALEVISPFTGTLDGKGHSLKNYTMSNLMSRTQVLFSSANGATFKNIKIEGYKATINSRMKGNLKIAGFNTGSVTSAYYTSSGKGIVNDAGVKASAKKVSSITFGNCPGLTSSNWKSSKGKLILKWQ